MLSLFIREPQFQGQTKEKLASAEATRLVETAIKDHFDHWLAGDPAHGRRPARRASSSAPRSACAGAQDKELARKTATRKLRLPGKLADCTRDERGGAPRSSWSRAIRAGGSAKQARNRETQAILPLRGKILNVASASADKLAANQELADLIQALGCGTGEHYDDEQLRYERSSS